MRATPCPSYATQHVKLTIATADTGRLIRAALWGLRRIYRPGFQYKKTGILFLDLAPAAAVQGSLFLRPDYAGADAPDGAGGRAERPLWARSWVRVLIPQRARQIGRAYPSNASFDCILESDQQFSSW